MQTYRATKPFHLGALRTYVQANETLTYDGSVVRVRGLAQPVPGFESLVEAGLVVLADPATAMQPVAAPTPTPPAPPPTPPNPDKAHVWEAEFGSTRKTCRACGVTMSADIRADRPSLKYRYTDVYGVTIESTTELPCPLFLGDLGGAVAGANLRARRLKIHVESIDDRVARLEAENARLRELTTQRQEEALALLRRLVSRAESLSPVEQPLLADTSQIFDAFDLPDQEPERVRIVLDQEVEEG